MNNRIIHLWKDDKPPSLFLYFLLVGILALGCFFWLALIPRDADSAFLFGYSLMRILLLLFLFVIILLNIYFIYQIFKSKRIYKKILDSITNKKNIKTIGLLSLFIFFCCTTFLIFAPFYKGGAYISYYQRLLPLMVWGVDFSVINSIFFKSKSAPKGIFFLDGIWRITILVFVILLLVWVFIYFTKIGITRDPVYWDNNPPVPILEGQLWTFWWLSVLALLGNEYLEKRLHRKKIKFRPTHLRWIDIFLFILIWAGAFLLWIKQPIPNCYFTPRVRPPNYEIYPYSDAGLNDTNSQSILLGEMAANSQIIKRPLYALFLAGVHAVVGQDYSQVVFLQTLFLALIPALSYLIGKEVGSRWVGFLLAGYTILFEWNTLQVASLTTTSNSKLLMTELPTTLLMACLVYVIILWSKKPAQKKHLSLVMGGFLGLNILLRSQTLVLVPFLILYFFLRLIKKGKVFLQAGFLFILGVALVISPWLIRNWQITGKIAFEDPKYTQVVIQLYESNQPDGTSSIIGNTEGQETSDFFGSAIGYILNNPGQYAGFVLNNFLHNEVLSIFTLPVRSVGVPGLSELFLPLDPFWIKPENRLGTNQVLIILVYLGLIACGIAQSYSSFKLAGLVPLFVHLAYNLSNGLSRISGWRFLQPIQWVVFFYFIIGVVYLVKWFYSQMVLLKDNKSNGFLFSIEGDSSETEKGPSHIDRKVFFWTVFFLLAGLAVVGIIQVIPQPYANQEKQQVEQELLELSSWQEIPEKRNAIVDLLQDENLIIEKGRAFYPKFYAAQDGEPSRNESIYNYQNFPRLIFVFIGQERREIMVPMRSSPNFFPNASEVILVGYETSNGFKVVLVALNTNFPILYFSESILK